MRRFLIKSSVALVDISLENAGRSFATFTFIKQMGGLTVKGTCLRPRIESCL